MKNTKFFIILACMTCIFYTSCEKTGYQMNDSRILDEKRIIPRDINDCDECPVDYCCCAIELDNLQEDGRLILCGVYDHTPPTTPCGTSNPPSPCSSISGNQKIIELGPGHTRELFCSPMGGSFSITNDDIHDIDIWFTCQPEVTNPDFEAITIPMGETRFFRSDGSCFLGGCN